MNENLTYEIITKNTETGEIVNTKPWSKQQDNQRYAEVYNYGYEDGEAWGHIEGYADGYFKGARQGILTGVAIVGLGIIVGSVTYSLLQNKQKKD